MKMLKAVEPKKIVTWSLVVMFSFLQIAPTGWAATRPVPVDELQARSVPGSVDALANTPAAAQPAPAPQKATGFVDSTVFQLSGSPLSRSTPEPVELPIGKVIDRPEVIKPLPLPTPLPEPIPSPKPIPVPTPIPEPIPIPKPIPIPTPIPPVVAAVKADLLKNLGIDAKQLEAWLKEGLIKIEYGNGQEVGAVMVSFSDQLRSQYDGLKNVNLFDPTGASGLPKSIKYYYVSNISRPFCTERGCTSDDLVRIELSSANITNWDGTVGVAKYSGGVLQQVNWYRHYRDGEPRPMIACRVGDATCGMVLDRAVMYDSVVSIPENPNPAHLLVIVVYHDGRAISKLEFDIGKLEDGKDHILKVREYGKDGKLSATNRFKYLVAVAMNMCLPGTKCVTPPAFVQLDSIVRTDANGKLLSTIRNIRKTDLIAYPMGASTDQRMPPIYLGNYMGDVVLADGQTSKVNFNDLSDLLEQARKFEQKNTIPPAVQAYLNALKKQLGNGFSVTATIQEDGMYLVKIARVNVCPPGAYCAQVAPAPGSFSSLEFKFMGNVDNYTVVVGQADYNGILVDGKLLFDALFSSSESLGITAPADAFQLMTRITVGSVEETGAIHFALEGKNYKAYRDENGNVKLEEELTPEQKAVAAVKEAVRVGLLNTFGFTKAMLDQLIKDGKILITVDLKKLTAIVTIDPSVTLPEGAVNLTDPLGLKTLPTTITYQYAVSKSFLGVCRIGGSCEQLNSYYLASASFKVGGLDYKLSYLPEGPIVGIPEEPFVGDNRLHRVSITKIDDPCGGNSQCMAPITITPVADISFNYNDRGIVANIVYHSPKNGVASREVTLGYASRTRLDGDDQLRIQTVVDKDANGNVIAQSSFNYAWGPMIYCIKAPCPQPLPRLVSISRTDANGNLISEIAINGDSALITLSGGSSKEVSFASLEELLDLARKFEQVKVLPPAVQAYIDALKKKLGNGFVVTVSGPVEASGTYFVLVTNSNFNPEAGGLKLLSFELDAQGKFQEQSPQAAYFGPNGKVLQVASALLFGAMKILQPGATNEDAVVLMTQVTIIEAVIDSTGTAWIRFKTPSGECYKTYYNNEGVALEKELPPAVQAYVDTLKKKLGNGFSVTTKLEQDGSYAVTVKRNSERILGGVFCEFLIFVLSADGLFQGVNTAVYRTAKHGSVSLEPVVANLLFEAVKSLTGDQANAALVEMFRVTVSRLDENGTIHFKKDSRHYKAYWDAEGKLKVEQELPPLVQAYVNELQNHLGKGFSVTATLQEDGTYRVKVGRVFSCPEGMECQTYVAPGALLSLEFNLSKDGVLNEDSIKADYNGLKVDAKLVFEGMLRLQNYCPPGMDCIALYRRDLQQAILDMTRIVVTRVFMFIDGLSFTLNGRSWILSRDAQGVVHLEPNHIIPIDPPVAVSPIMRKAPLVINNGDSGIGEKGDSLSISLVAPAPFRGTAKSKKGFARAGSLRIVSAALRQPLSVSSKIVSDSLLGFRQEGLLSKMVLTELTK